jgi:hypothetical protein
LFIAGVTLSLSVRSLSGSCLTSGSNNIDIGHQGFHEESGAIRIGTVRVHTSAFIAGIRDVPLASAVPVGVTTSGQLGVPASSKHFKEAIRPMNAAGEANLCLKPVTFRYKQELDNDGILQFGLVAEDVEKVNPDLVVRDDQGKVYTVRYEAVNAMLLNEFLKVHAKVEQLKKDFESKIAEQQKQIEALTAMVREQAAQIQEVNARLATIQPVTGLVTNE